MRAYPRRAAALSGRVRPMASPTRSSRAVTRRVLLLRGVNVGTKNSLPMADLRAMLETLGCVGVRTYVQSGNAVFGTTRGEAEITEAIEAALARHMGRPIATTMRTEEEMRAIVAASPLADVATRPAHLCVTFLSQPPDEAEIAPLRARDWAPERFALSGREIHTWHPDGQGRSALAAAIAKLPLRGTVTTRNWNTVIRLAEMLRAAST